jgi:hypothetical protein
MNTSKHAYNACTRSLSNQNSNTLPSVYSYRKLPAQHEHVFVSDKILALPNFIALYGGRLSFGGIPLVILAIKTSKVPIELRPLPTFSGNVDKSRTNGELSAE